MASNLPIYFTSQSASQRYLGAFASVLQCNGKGRHLSVARGVSIAVPGGICPADNSDGEKTRAGVERGSVVSFSAQALGVLPVS